MGTDDQKMSYHMATSGSICTALRLSSCSRYVCVCICTKICRQGNHETHRLTAVGEPLATVTVSCHCDHHSEGTMLHYALARGEMQCFWRKEKTNSRVMGMLFVSD